MTLYRRNPQGSQGQGAQRSFGGSRGRKVGGTLIIGLVVAGFALFRFCSSSDFNEILGTKQYVGITEEQEIAIGLESTPQMIEQYGGLYPGEQAQQFVKQVGNRIVANSDASKTPYQYDFHLLAHPEVVNAFALPGGQVFITAALFERLENEEQLAGVLGHEIGHVVARHGAERIAKMELTQGLTGAAVIASGDYSTAEAAQMIANLINMSYGRDQELLSDELGVRFMVSAGYDPNALIGVMAILAQASGGQRQPEFASTHPSPENRVERIREAIQKYSGKPATQ